MAGIDLGNKTREEALYALRPRFVELESTDLTFVYEGNKFSKSLYEWGVNLEATSSAKKAYSVGRSGNIFETSREKLKAGFEDVSLSPVVDIDEEGFSAAIVEVEDVVNTPVEETRYQIEGNKLKVIAGIDGRQVDRKSFREDLILAGRDFVFTLRTVPTQTVLAHPPGLFEEHKAEAEEIVFSRPQIVFGPRKWVLHPEQVLELLDFEYVEVSDLNNPRVERMIEIKVNETALSALVSDIAQEINRPVRGGTFELGSGRVIDFSLPQEGRKVQEAETAARIRSLILDPEKEEVDLPVEITKIESDSNKYGIKEHLATGSSSFKGSSSGRIQNLDLASARLDGILIPPEEVFSFNSTLGEISSETGYKTSYIIKEGRTILGVGGGVCQVSTTIFRAALNAGFPIVERVAHAYRVHYYEQDKGPGFDATVYSPSPDLKFKNNTPAYILIKRNYNPKNHTLSFSFYGTDDGRKVNITGPITHSQTPPPDPEYIEDESLPPGETKQIDWAAWGARVTVKRKVTRSGEVLEEDTFYSNYQPWRAVYLVGKED